MKIVTSITMDVSLKQEIDSMISSNIFPSVSRAIEMGLRRVMEDYSPELAPSCSDTVDPFFDPFQYHMLMESTLFDIPDFYHNYYFMKLKPSNDARLSLISTKPVFFDHNNTKMGPTDREMSIFDAIAKGVLATWHKIAQITNKRGDK